MVRDFVEARLEEKSLEIFRGCPSFLGAVKKK